ncbi:hypothetical protein [Sphingobium indicum]
MRITFRDTCKSRAIALIALPPAYSRRIRTTVSKINIPISPPENPAGCLNHRNEGSLLDADHPANGVLFARRSTFRAGERVLLDRVKPASINADVLIQLRDEAGRSLWTAGRLLARDRNLIELRQYREQATALIPHGQIKQVFPIIGMIDDNV